MSELVKLKNIGPKTAKWLGDIGVHSLADIEELGVITAYIRLKDAYPQANLNALWSLQGALINLPYNQLPEDLKQDLLNQLKVD